MLKRIMFVYISILMSMPSVLAQVTTNDEQWYWAWIEATHEVIAYTIDGEITVLSNADYVARVQRFDSQSAFARLSINGAYGLYYLTSTDVYEVWTAVETGFDAASLDYHERGSLPVIFLIDVHLPYVLMMNQDDTIRFLYNLEEKTVLPLDVEMASARFSENGETLHYLTLSQTEQEIQLGLGEYTISTGATITFYSRTIPVTNDADFRASCYLMEDESWLCTLNNYQHPPYESSEVERWLIFRDGTTQSLPIEEALRRRRFSITQETYWISLNQQPCVKNCVVEIEWMTDQQLTTFHIPSSTPDSEPVYISFDDAYPQMINREHLMLRQASTYYALSVDGEWITLGNYFCCDLPHESSGGGGRWQLLYRNAVVLWDMFSLEIVLELDISFGGSCFAENGALIRDLDGNNWAYNFSDMRLYELPQVVGGSFWEQLPNGIFLYEQSGRPDVQPIGIYRYTVDDGFTMLVEGAKTPEYTRFLC